MSIGLAVKVARANSSHPQWMLGSVLVRGGSVLSIGWNKPKNDPGMKEIEYRHLSVHAEEDAIRQVDDASRATLYVARWRRGQTVGVAKPCARCMLTIEEAGIKKVVWTIDAHSVGMWRSRQLVD